MISKSPSLSWQAAGNALCVKGWPGTRNYAFASFWLSSDNKVIKKKAEIRSFLLWRAAQ
jgi:hypothetical protein